MGLLDAFRKSPVRNKREEVVASLRHLLSTKQSYGAWQKELGLDDYSGANYSTDILRKIEEDVALNIAMYEKRFTVRHVEISSFKSYADFEVKVEGDIEGKDTIIYLHITRRKESNVSVRFF